MGSKRLKNPFIIEENIGFIQVCQDINQLFIKGENGNISLTAVNPNLFFQRDFL